MLREMTDIMVRILEEQYRDSGLSMIEICVEMDEIRIFIEEEEEMEDIIIFAYDLAISHQCIVHVVSILDDSEEDEEEVILVFNERYVSKNGIKVILK